MRLGRRLATGVAEHPPTPAPQPPAPAEAEHPTGEGSRPAEAVAAELGAER